MIAEIELPILGVDFLFDFNFSINFKKNILIKNSTRKEIKGEENREIMKEDWTELTNKTKFCQLLKDQVGSKKVQGCQSTRRMGKTAIHDSTHKVSLQCRSSA